MVTCSVRGPALGLYRLFPNGRAHRGRRHSRRPLASCLNNGSLFIAELLGFFMGRPPSFWIAPLSALINASLAQVFDRGRPSHPIYGAFKGRLREMDKKVE